MPMKCEPDNGGCGNLFATRISYSKGKECCNLCGASQNFSIPDVYFRKPYFDENITDPVKSPHGTEITSRRHKAEVLKQNGLREFGDKRHGSRDRF